VINATARLHAAAGKTEVDVRLSDDVASLVAEKVAAHGEAALDLLTQELKTVATSTLDAHNCLAAVTRIRVPQLRDPRSGQPFETRHGSPPYRLVANRISPRPPSSDRSNTV
jgi:hypothetical protein